MGSQKCWNQFVNGWKSDRYPTKQRNVMFGIIFSAKLRGEMYLWKSQVEDKDTNTPIESHNSKGSRRCSVSHWKDMKLPSLLISKSSTVFLTSKNGFYPHWTYSLVSQFINNNNKKKLHITLMREIYRLPWKDNFHKKVKLWLSKLISKFDLIYQLRRKLAGNHNLFKNGLKVPHIYSQIRNVEMNFANWCKLAKLLFPTW